MLTRREFSVSTIAAIGVGGLFPTTAVQAQERRFELTEIPAALDASITLSTNPQAPTAVYVIAAPWCPFCRQLYEAQAAANLNIDLRFVMTSFRDLGSAVVAALFSGEADAAGFFYRNTRPQATGLSPDAERYYEGINQVVINQAILSLQGRLTGINQGSSGGGRVSYPTVVGRGADGSTSAVLGAFNFIEDLPSIAVPSAPTNNSAYMAYLREAPPISRINNRPYFAVRDGVELRAAPLASGPIVERLRNGSGYRMDGMTVVNGERWIGAEAFTSGFGYLWARETDLFTQ